MTLTGEGCEARKKEKSGSGRIHSEDFRCVVLILCYQEVGGLNRFLAQRARTIIVEDKFELGSNLDRGYFEVAIRSRLG